MPGESEVQAGARCHKRSNTRPACNQATWRVRRKYKNCATAVQKRLDWIGNDDCTCKENMVKGPLREGQAFRIRQFSINNLEGLKVCQRLMDSSTELEKLFHCGTVYGEFGYVCVYRWRSNLYTTSPMKLKRFMFSSCSIACLFGSIILTAQGMYEADHMTLYVPKSP